MLKINRLNRSTHKHVGASEFYIKQLMRNMSNSVSSATNPNQASDRGAALAALGAFLGHRSATSFAESEVPARAAVEIRRRTASAARRLQLQIHR